MKNLTLIYLLFLAVILACKEPFSPKVDAQFRNLLVVEGYLNIGGSTNFTLSRTGDLKDWQSRIPEASAKIEVEDRQGVVVEGISKEKGECVLTTTNLDVNKSYRIKITTKNSKIYQTDFLESKLTPEIDSISRRIENNGFKLYVSSHDSSNKTRFYSWDYRETWEILSPIVPSLEYKNGQIVERDQSLNISRCWQENTSFEILLASSERLSEDRIPLAPITFIPGSSIKLAELYSILIRQYAHTREGYHYLENMKKNTEKIGTIFDPQPSELVGNITCITDPEEQVIGWIGAGTVSQKRMFISKRDRLPGWTYQMKNCTTKIVPLDLVPSQIAAGFLLDQKKFPDPPPMYYMARAACIDCRLMGSNVKPSYWPR